MSHVRLTQIDGKLPNLALMDLAYRHRERGDDIYFTKSVERGFLEPDFERVYGSAIFEFSRPRVERLLQSFPDAIVGGSWNKGVTTTVAELLGPSSERYDYSIYPDFSASIGFTQRGCRLKCGFCGVRKKEGTARAVHTISEIYRGEPFPRHLHLLDNDFFGQHRTDWESRLGEIRDGGFKVCFNQGINIRMIDKSSAAALAVIPYFDDSFKYRRLYTAWDNIGDEARFFKGVDLLREYGIPPSHLFVYMLVGYDPRETWQRIFYRFNKMVALGIRPYPMPFQGNKSKQLPLGGHNAPIAHRTLGEFQRWVIRKAYTFRPFEAYDVNAKGRIPRDQTCLEFASAA